MTKIQLTESEINAIVKKVISEALSLNEEKGINKDVTAFTNRIIKQLRSYAFKGTPQTDDDGFKYVKGSFETLFKNLSSCIVEYQVYRFSNKNEYERFCSLENSETQWMAYAKQSENKIIINTYTIGGRYDVSSLYDSVQHEVEHIYQHLKSNTQLMWKKEDFYKQITKNLPSKDNNGWNKRLAIVGYLYFNEERCAFVNGMYAYVMKVCKDPDKIEMCADKTEAAHYLDALGEIETLLYEGDDFVGLSQALEEFKPRDYKWFRENSTIIYNKFLNQFNKVIEKARIDIMKKYGKTDLIPNLSYYKE